MFLEVYGRQKLIVQTEYHLRFVHVCETLFMASLSCCSSSELSDGRPIRLEFETEVDDGSRQDKRVQADAVETDAVDFECDRG